MERVKGKGEGRGVRAVATVCRKAHSGTYKEARWQQ